MSPRIKICGITNIEDALVAADLGVEALGFVFAESPRRVEPVEAKKIMDLLPPFISRVGVFVDEDIENIHEIAELCGLDAVQLHGLESPDYCRKVRRRVIKAFRIKEEKDLKIIPKYYEVNAYLLDTYVPEIQGGTGVAFDWTLALKAQEFGKPIILAGGLTPENVTAAIKVVQPYAVDVSSSIEERPGKKDLKKLKAFVEAVKFI